MEGNVERKKEITDVFLKTFIEKGLSETSTRDLSNAINLQSGALYYYFSSKDEAVVACAEKAAIQIENNLFSVALSMCNQPRKMFEELISKASNLSPTMKFFTQVSSTPKYRKSMDSILLRLSLRYRYYSKKFAEKINCKVEDIEPYVYISVTAIANYMIFGEECYIEPQINYVINRLEERAWKYKR